MFKDEGAREKIKELIDGHNNVADDLQNLYKSINQLASTLGYEYKEETKEAGWVKKRLLENVTTNVSPGGSGCTGGGAGESMFTSVPDKTDAEYAEEFMKSDKHGNSGYPIIIRLPKTKKPKKSKSK